MHNYTNDSFFNKPEFSKEDRQQRNIKKAQYVIDRWETKDKSNFDIETETVSNIDNYMSKIKPDGVFKSHRQSISIQQKDVTEVIANSQQPGHKIGVMNFASPINPGGGWERGFSAQEEAICRNSYLYFSLIKEHSNYYEYNKLHMNDFKFSNRFIYSNDVPFITTDKEDQVDESKAYSKADVVTIAAPMKNAVKSDVSTSIDMNMDIDDKIHRTLKAFAINDVDTIILGSFGTGAFGNDPLYVAMTFQKYLSSPEFITMFDNVIFAIHDRKTADVFRIAFEIK